MRQIYLQIISFLALTTAAATADAALTDYALTPAADEPLASLGSVTIRFPEAKFLDMYGSQLYGVTLTKEDDPSVVYEPVNSIYHTNNSQTFSFRPKGSTPDSGTLITEPGRYILHFPAKTFNLCGDWFTHLGYSDEISAIYTIQSDGGDGFTDYFPEDHIGLRPLPGDVLEFSDISLTLPLSNAYAVIERADFSLIRLYRLGDDPKTYVTTNCSNDYDGNIVLQFRSEDSKYGLPETFYKPGEYLLDIPAGVFRQNQPTLVNPHMELSYTVGSKLTASFDDSVIFPAAGTVDAISEVTVEFPHLTGGFNFPEGVNDVTDYFTNRLTLVKLNSDPDMMQTWLPYSVTRTAPNKLAIRFKTKVQTTDNPQPVRIDARGDYRLTILPNTIKEAGTEYSFNPRIEVDYTIDRTATSSPFDDAYFAPADGTTLASFSQMTLNFPNITEGMVWPFDNAGIRMIRRDNPQTVYKITNVMMGRNIIYFSFSRPESTYGDPETFTEAGVYDITVDAGIFKDDSNMEISNPELHCTLTVDPSLNFRSIFAPASGSALTALDAVTLTAHEDCQGVGVTEEGYALPQFVSGQTRVDATPKQVDPRTISFLPTEALTPANWTITFPAGYLTETTSTGAVVANSSDITLRYEIVEPLSFPLSIYPTSGAAATGFPTFTVTVSGDGLQSLQLDEKVWTPLLRSSDRDYPLTARINLNAVVLETSETLPVGEYSLDIPAGYIVSTDLHGLSAPLPAISAQYTVTPYVPTNLSSGIFFLNEGWYGTDYGSVNFLSSDYDEMEYRVFAEANNGASPGVTSQYGEIYGDRFFIVSKQRSYTERGGVLTVVDAATMRRECEVALPADGRSVCGVNTEKVYVSTAAGVYVYHIGSTEIGSLIEGTASDSGNYKDQIGDMVRLSDRVYAAWQEHGVLVINTATDTVERVLPMEDIVSVFVTAEGDLYAATADGFVFISTDGEYYTVATSVEAPVAATWTSWRKAPLATAIRGNNVYYLTAEGASRVVSYDLDNDRLNIGFITLPSGMTTYGSAVSTDPTTGYVVVTAVGAGGGENYSRNAIYFADPVQGGIIPTLTFVPHDYYWFPAMAIYPVEGRPELRVPGEMALGVGESVEVDIPSMTLLSVGHTGLMTYTATVTPTDGCRLKRTAEGVYTLTGLKKGAAELKLTAEYRGVATEATIPLRISESEGVGVVGSEEAPADVYGIDGVLVRRAATADEIARLPRGIYIIQNRKVIIK